MLAAESESALAASRYPGAAMFGFTLRETHRVSGVAVAAAIAAGSTLYWMSRKRPSPDELERDRRDVLVQKGRIIDATVLDISELSPEESDRPLGMQLIL